jgi:hypothetical protein
MTTSLQARKENGRERVLIHHNFHIFPSAEFRYISCTVLLDDTLLSCNPGQHVGQPLVGQISASKTD